MTGSSGFLGRHLRRELEKFDIQPLTLIHISQEQSFEITGSFSLVLSGGYSPVSNRHFSTSQARQALESIEKIFTNSKLSIERAVLVSSTDAGLPLSPSATPQPRQLYAQHKLDFESKVLGWAKRSGFPLAILRIGPLYGPGEEHYQRLIPSWIDSASRGERFKFSGPADFSRPYLYVDDAAEVIASFTVDRFRPGLLEFVGAEEIGTKRIQSAVELAVQSEVSSQRPSHHRTVGYSITKNAIILNSYTKFEDGIRSEVRARHESSDSYL